MSEGLPSAARAVVIGGGIMGASTAYHLARYGFEDVVLLERKQLTSGTTWHAAGLVRALRPSSSMTRLIRYSVELYQGLEAETGQETGWMQCGSLTVATNPDRLHFLKRQASLARVFDAPVHEVGIEEISSIWPLLNTDDLVGAVYAPEDGRVNPSDTAAALAKGARNRGVRIFEDTRVTGFERRGNRIHAVCTDAGRIECEVAVIASGLWSHQLAGMAGAVAPLHACEHFYILTKPIDGVARDLPTLGNPDDYLYGREDVGGLLVGSFEPNAKALPLDKLPPDFSFDLLNEDWDHFEPMLENAIRRIPALEQAEVRMLLNGPESFTLDNHYILGESPQVGGLFIGCGFNSTGIASSGGAGRALAEWIVEGEPTMDLSEVDVARFAPFQNTLEALHARIPEILGRHYELAYPGVQPETVRGLRRSPLHGHHVEAGAHFGTRGGWERPEWFHPPGGPIELEYSFERPSWFDRVAAEHRAAREGVVLVDQTSFGKILVQGPDAERFLDRLCANRMSVPVGAVVYTPMLNPRGGIESDVTVQRLDADRFLLVTGTAQLVRDMAWLARRTGGDSVYLTDVTSAWAVLGVAGPRSQALLERLGPTDLSPSAFAAYTSREIEIGYALVRAARLSYTGEAGFELYVPTEFAAGVCEALHEAGRDLDLTDIGHQALGCLRLERGFRSWGHDIGPDDTPLEAGLGFTVKADKETDFIGRGAFLAQRQRGVERRLVFLTMESVDAMPLGTEPILYGDEVVGQVTSAGYGHTVGRSIAMGYVRGTLDETRERIGRGGFAIELATRREAASASLSPPYPGGKSSSG